MLRFYGVSSFQGKLNIIVDYCDGGALDSYIKANPAMPWKQRVHYLSCMAKGLDALHRRKIIHRDVKLGNVLVHKGICVIADFGLSRRTETADGGAGTPV